MLDSFMTGFAGTLTVELYFGRMLELPECTAILCELSFESVAGRLVLLWHVR